MSIQIKTPEQIALMRKAGLLVGQTLELLRAAIAPGVTTGQLDALAEEHIRSNGGIPSFKGYYGFPATICASINDQIVHGIPGSQVIQDGDLVSIDCGAIVEGWHGDSAFSVVVGEASQADQKMVEVCTDAMWAGIAAAKVGGRLTDISHAIESYITSHGSYGIVEEYGGHGIGSEMHQEPHLLNYGKPGKGPELIPGLALAVEPMITLGSARNKTLADEWTVVTRDGSRAAHVEQSFTLMPDGRPWVLTSLDGGVSQLARFGVQAYNPDFPQA